MSRGKQGVFTFVAALATVATMAVVPAFAVTTSGSVAATDDRAPEPVSDVTAFPGAEGVEVAWALSPSDHVRQSPTGTDFTSGGTFVNVNDVAGYNVWRSDAGLEPELLDTVLPGTMTFIDPLPVGSSITYSVTAIDAAGNESAIASALPITLGPPPTVAFDPELAELDFGVAEIDEVIAALINVANVSEDAEALLNVSIAVEGPGFATDTDLITLNPGEGVDFELSFDAAEVGNLSGIYEGVVVVRTNDPETPEVIVPLVAEIIDGLSAPDINVSPLVVAFSSQRVVNTTGTRAVTLENLGGLPLTGSFVVNGDAFSVGASTSINREPGTSRVINVNFTPTEVGSFSGSLVFTTNDPDEPEVTVTITGGAVLTPTGPGTIQTQSKKVTLTFADADSLDFNDDAAVQAFIDQLIADLAAAMGIDASRITGVTVTQGSIVVNFTVAPSSDSTEPTPDAAVTSLTTAVADTTADAFPSVTGAVQSVSDTTEVVTLQPLDDGGEPVVGWFTRSEDTVGFNDFFAFADKFGLSSADAGFDSAYDIAPADTPDGNVGFDDFFVFADNFGKTVANAAEIRVALGE